MGSVEEYQIYDSVGDLARRSDAILRRRFPDRPLEPTFLMQPLDTKHQIFPTNDRANDMAYRNDLGGLREAHPPLDVGATFVPPTGVKGPWSGYVGSLDTEMRLQRRFFANQRYCDQAEYVPPLESPMYSVEGPQKDWPAPRNRRLYSREARDTDAPIAPRSDAGRWNMSSRLDFHRRYDSYREYE